MIPPVFKILMLNKLLGWYLLNSVKDGNIQENLLGQHFCIILKKKIHKEVELGNTYPTH